MGQHTQKRHRASTNSHTLPSSPTHSSSSSSSDFEFTISLSPQKSSTALCPADELFYKGQLLPLHLSPRLSMVRTLLLSSSSTSSSSDTITTASGRSSTDCDSSRPSSATDDEFKGLTTNTNHPRSKPSKYFSLPKLFKKEPKSTPAPTPPPASGGASVKRVSSTAREVIRKYLRKVKPLYEKLSQKQHKIVVSPPPTSALPTPPSKQNIPANILHSFSGNLRYPARGRSCIASCPSSMGSSPSHGKNDFGYGSPFSQMGRVGSGPDTSTMEELQSAIQGAIAHCKNSMLQNKTMVSNEI
ncbi:hypothetical protein CDL12_27926 [Handroanthus impetiginosus]|uniref:Membrane-associated kinase regulator 1 n=1 Tax=Handroanthus impetiginosus TaxID=429701 RepID=A0A2G9G2Q6_9LAMI|nr:hypothetical protein CDL12_27926 [Handroanthus impetiginosus]